MANTSPADAVSLQNLASTVKPAEEHHESHVASADPSSPEQVTSQSTEPPQTTVPDTSTQVATPEQAVPDVSSATPTTASAEPAITPAPAPLTSSPSQSKNEPAARITLLLSTGNRHPFTINNKILQKHDIQVPEGDLWNISVYDAKLLIWKAWLEQWDTRPLNPTSIRLIYMGGLLDDKLALKDCRFSRTDNNVVHMTIKPQDTAEDEDGHGKEQNAAASRARSSNCCVIL